MMQTRLYDNEELFRAIILVLKKNKIKFITQEAFNKCLIFAKKNIDEKFEVDCTFFGDNKFSEFTEYTKKICYFFSKNKVAFIGWTKEEELKESIFNSELIETVENEECMSVFGLSSSPLFNYRNFVNKISDQEKIEIKKYFENSRNGDNNSSEFDF